MIEQTPDLIILIAGTAWLIPLLRCALATPLRDDEDQS
jgi:hypothetical protein